MFLLIHASDTGFWNTHGHVYIWDPCLFLCLVCRNVPESKVHGANMGAHLGPTGPSWSPCWPHELSYLGCCVGVQLTEFSWAVKGFQEIFIYSQINLLIGYSECKLWVQRNNQNWKFPWKVYNHWFNDQIEGHDMWIASTMVSNLPI